MSLVLDARSAPGGGAATEELLLPGCLSVNRQSAQRVANELT